MFTIHVTYTDHSVTIHHFEGGTAEENRASALEFYHTMFPSRHNNVANIRVYQEIHCVK